MFWRMRGQRALRRGDWKYLRLTDGIDRIFDLGTDAREYADQVRNAPEFLADLKAAWEATDTTLLPYPA